MDRLALLRSDTGGDSQALETDVMRFVAIIGIIFWIIFALIKSIPVMDTQARNTNDRTALKPVETEKRATVFVIPENRMQTTAVERKAPYKKEEKNTNKPSVPAPASADLNLQFRSMDDLLQLLAAHRVEIYCRARAKGFDLFFRGGLQAGKVIFHGTDTVPPVLWEIRSGRDYTWFSNRLAETCPAVRTFPVKQVLVAFIDRELEKRVDTEFSTLDRQGKKGFLSVTGKGEVVFEQAERNGQHKSKTQKQN